MATARQERKALLLESLMSLEDKSVDYQGQWLFAGSLCQKKHEDELAREVLLDHGVLADGGRVSRYPGLKEAFLRQGPPIRRIYSKTSAYLVNEDAFNMFALSLGRGRFEPRYRGTGR